MLYNLLIFAVGCYVIRESIPIIEHLYDDYHRKRYRKRTQDNLKHEPS